MSRISWFTFPASLALLLTASVSSAAPITGIVTSGETQVSWEAARQIVTTLTPGTSAYVGVHGTGPGYSGIAGLIIDKGGSSSLCTGSLISAYYMVTAAHCLTNDVGAVDALSVTSVFFPDAGGTYVDATTTFFVHPDYSGSVFDDHDIAIVRLGARAPGPLARYALHQGSAVGEVFETVGFGSRGQGNTGTTIPAGTRVRGFNEFDALGADLLPFLGVTSANSVYMFDFDNGSPDNDAFGYWLGLSGLGLGIFESMTGPGDSGGPSFVNGRIAAVTSFGLTFTATLPTGELLTSDVLPGLQSSFGEFAGNTSIQANQAWIDSVAVPEPGLCLLVALGVATTLRRRSGTR